MDQRPQHRRKLICRKHSPGWRIEHSSNRHVVIDDLAAKIIIPRNRHDARTTATAKNYDVHDANHDAVLLLHHAIRTCFILDRKQPAYDCANRYAQHTSEKSIIQSIYRSLLK